MQVTNFKGSVVNLGDKIINVGDKAPEVTLVNTSLDDVVVGGSKDKVQLLIAVPSLDTGTCAKETREFNKLLSTLDIVETYVISMDLPFASDRFCVTEGIENLDVLSDYTEKTFSSSYGVLMKDNKLKGLSARAIFIVNKDGLVTYKQVVNEVTDEPDYEAVLEAIKDTTI